MNDQELKEKLAYILYSDAKAFTTELNEILELIKQDQAQREIDIRIDELEKFNIYEQSQGRHKCFYDSNNNTIFSINSRIAELQAQKDKLIEGIE